MTDDTKAVDIYATASLQDRKDYAVALAQSGLLPKAYQQAPANVLYAVEYGAALGVPPMTAIMGINVIAGKPSLSADLMAALVRRAGHRLRITVAGPANDPTAVAELIRHDDPSFTYTARWTLDRAKAAGLLGKDNWKNYPAAMLKARAISEVVREGASEVLHGLIYTADELGSSEFPTSEEGAPPNVDFDTGEVVDGDVVEDRTPTEGQEPLVDAFPDDGGKP